MCGTERLLSRLGGWTTDGIRSILDMATMHAADRLRAYTAVNFYRKWDTKNRMMKACNKRSLHLDIFSRRNKEVVFRTKTQLQQKSQKVTTVYRCSQGY